MSGGQFNFVESVGKQTIAFAMLYLEKRDGLSIEEREIMLNLLQRLSKPLVSYGSNPINEHALGK